MVFKKYKYIIILMAILTIIMLISFYQFYKENFGYSKVYYQIYENCYNKKDTSYKHCEYFKTSEQLDSYIKLNNPKERLKKLDTITLTCSIVETSLFSMLQFFSPLIIIFALIFSVKPELTSCYFKNILLREDYKKYKKQIFKKFVVISISTPIILLIVFLISNIITKFNYNLPSEISTYAVYDKWKYNNFILYGFSICIIQFFINISYCCIGLYSCLKNKNSIVATIMGYILFLIMDIIIYIIIYALIINKILGFKNLTDFFNITGYWFFNIGPSFMYVILISFIIQLLSLLLIARIYKSKERIIIAYEKQNA